MGSKASFNWCQMEEELRQAIALYKENLASLAEPQQNANDPELLEVRAAVKVKGDCRCLPAHPARVGACCS